MMRSFFCDNPAYESKLTFVSFYLVFTLLSVQPRAMKRNASWMDDTNNLNLNSPMDSLWSIAKMFTACSNPLSYQSVAIDINDPTFEDLGKLRLHASRNNASFYQADVNNNLQQCRIPSSECMTKICPLEDEYGANDMIQRSHVNYKNKTVSKSNSNLPNTLDSVLE